MDVAAEAEGDGQAGGGALEVDGDAAEVLGVVAELDLASDKGGVDLVAVAEQVDAGGASDAAQAGPAEGLLEELGVGCPVSVWTRQLR